MNRTLRGDSPGLEVVFKTRPVFGRDDVSKVYVAFAIGQAQGKVRERVRILGSDGPPACDKAR